LAAWKFRDSSFRLSFWREAIAVLYVSASAGFRKPPTRDKKETWYWEATGTRSSAHFAEFEMETQLS